jgi:hypothetical protein
MSMCNVLIDVARNPRFQEESSTSKNWRLCQLHCLLCMPHDVGSVQASHFPTTATTAVNTLHTLVVMYRVVSKDRSISGQQRSVLGRAFGLLPWSTMHQAQQGTTRLHTPHAGEAPELQPFRLLSCFKWEERKGWDVLLAAYLQVGGRAGGRAGSRVVKDVRLM